MSNYHIKDNSNNGRDASVVFHIPIPIENNSVPISFRLAISEYIKPINADGTYGVFNSKLQGISSTELTQLQNGETYERQETVKFLALDSNLEKQNKIDTRYVLLSSKLLSKLRSKLKFWGKSRNVI